MTEHEPITPDPARQARYAKGIRDELERIGVGRVMMLPDIAIIARAVIALADAEVELIPAEQIALTVALAQVQRGEAPAPNVAAVCVITLARLAGRDLSDDDPFDRGDAR